MMQGETHITQIFESIVVKDNELACYTTTALPNHLICKFTPGSILVSWLKQIA